MVVSIWSWLSIYIIKLNNLSTKDILASCENRYVVFDNKTKDETKKAKQCERLFSLIDVVLLKNGRPYTNEISEELQKEAWKLQKKVFDSKVDIKVMLELLQKSYGKQLEGIIKMVELKLKETTTEFEKRLEEEKAARREAEKEAQSARTEAQAEMGKLREDEKAQKADRSNFGKRQPWRGIVRRNRNRAPLTPTSTAWSLRSSHLSLPH